VGHFLLQNRSFLAPIAGAFIIIFGLHLLGLLIKLSFRAGIVLGLLFVLIGIIALLRHVTHLVGLEPIHFFSFSLVGFLGPSLTRWLNRDVRLHSGDVKQPGIWSGFLLGFAFAFGWTPCIGPILTTVLAIAAASDHVGRGVLLLATYSAGLSIPFLLTALGIGQFMAFYKSFRKYLHAVELFSGALLLFIGGLVFLNKLTWLTTKLEFLNVMVRWLEHALTTGRGPIFFWVVFGVFMAGIVLSLLAKNWSAIASSSGKKTGLIVGTVVVLIVVTVIADKLTGGHPTNAALQTSAAVPDTVVGSPEPEVSFKDLNDKDVTLSSYKGKVVLVNFWATWCEPCQVEIPWLIEMQQKYADKGFTILGVDVDDEGKAAVAPFVQKERFNVNGQKVPFNYPIFTGNDTTADKFGGLLGYPTSILISRDGKQIKRITGLISYDEISKAIESQL
jgi:cytochrome c biogenesis protein CcdA/thiol-disulfide isomerase/thioredoxin